MSQSNPYQLLGVSLDATLDEVMSAFRDKVRDLGQEMSVTDPNYSRHRSALYQAVSMLTDPEKRKQLDASLGGVEGPIKPTDVKYIWQMVGKLFFERTERYTPTFDAMRNSIPLTVENDNLLIVGMDPMHGNLTGYLNSSEQHATLRRILSEVCGRPMDFRVVPAVNLKDWTMMREAEERRNKRPNGISRPASAQPSSLLSGVAQPASQPSSRPFGAAQPAPQPSSLLSGIAQTAPPPQTASSVPPQTSSSMPPQTASSLIDSIPAVDEWDEVMEGLMRLWSATGSRSFPQVRAKLILDSLAMIARTEAAARARNMPEDLMQRALGRALDRVGSLTGTDSALIGVEYLRIRDRGTGG
ncbi:MAG: J domain-containing protein [Armatimonadota bacterium]